DGEKGEDRSQLQEWLNLLVAMDLSAAGGHSGREKGSQFVVTSRSIRLDERPVTMNSALRGIGAYEPHYSNSRRCGSKTGSSSSGAGSARPRWRYAAEIAWRPRGDRTTNSRRRRYGSTSSRRVST